MDIVKYTKDNAFIRIKSWYMDEDSVILSDKDIIRRDRLLHIYSLRKKNKYSPHQAIEIAMRDHKISQATAYRDYSLAMELFGNIDQANIEAERSVLAESYWNLYQMALKKGQEETARKCLDSYRSLFNFGDTEQKVDPKKLEASVYVMKLPRKTGKILDKMVETGSMNLNGVFTEDAEFEEITPDEDTEDDNEY